MEPVPNRTELERQAEAVSSSLTGVFNAAKLGLRGDMVLIVAVSGGPDSVCLLHALHEFAGGLKAGGVSDPALFSERGFNLHVAHLHHGQREKGDEDARFVQELAEKLSLPCTVERADVPRLAKEERLSIEVAGRAARYRFFARLAETLASPAVATGHHADDHAETVLLRLFRGAGLWGLRGIPTFGPMPESGGRVTVIRPLIRATRAEIEGYLKLKGLPSRLDATNLDLSIQRNRIRHELFPLAEAISPGARRGLLRLARDTRETEEALLAWVNQAWEACGHVEEGRVMVHIEALPEPAAIRRRVLRRAIEALDPETGIAFPEANIRGLLMDCVPEDGFGRGGPAYDFAGGMVVFRQYDPDTRQTHLVFKWRREEEARNASPLRRPVRVPGPTEIPELSLRLLAEEIPLEAAQPYPPRDAWEAVMDADALKGRCFVRSWVEGDRIRVLGSGGTRKLQDLFTDAKIPSSERRKWPLLCDLERIVWVPGLALHDAVKITPATSRVYRLRLLRPDESG